MGWRVALTFDAEHPDRPARVDGTSRVVGLLRAAGAPATFFLQGRWVEANPELARAIAADGHLIGNHSHHHAPMPTFTPAGMSADVRAAERVIRRVTAVDPRPWFRCPFGAGADDPGVLARLDRLGYRDIGWDVDSLDWRRQATGPAVAQAVIRQAAAHGDGAIALFHPWTTATGRALPAILSGLRAAGADFVRVDDLA